MMQQGKGVKHDHCIHLEINLEKKKNFTYWVKGIENILFLDTTAQYEKAKYEKYKATKAIPKRKMNCCSIHKQYSINLDILVCSYKKSEKNSNKYIHKQI